MDILCMMLVATASEQSVAKSIEEIANSLQQISSSLTSTQFWDTQWFAAFIGAFSATAVFVVAKLIAWRRKIAADLLDYCKWLNEQLTYRAPDILLREAHSTTYAFTRKDESTGEEKMVPEKPLGEKMIIELRRGLKWWRIPSWRLRRLFSKYEESLRSFDQLDSANKELEKKLISESESLFGRIERFAYNVTGDDEYTSI